MATKNAKSAKGGKGEREGWGREVFNAEKTEGRRRGEREEEKVGSNDRKNGQNRVPMIGKTAKPGSNDWKIRGATTGQAGGRE